MGGFEKPSRIAAISSAEYKGRGKNSDSIAVSIIMESSQQRVKLFFIISLSYFIAL